MPYASDELTPREREVVQLIGAGLSNKRIARALGIAESTAKAHVHKVFLKMRLRNRTEVALRVVLEREEA